MLQIVRLTDEALRQTIAELRKGQRLDDLERERLLRILAETETAIFALGTRIGAANVIIEGYEFELNGRAADQSEDRHD
jgi:hypothetical protein